MQCVVEQRDGFIRDQAKRVELVLMAGHCSCLDNVFGSEVQTMRAERFATPLLPYSPNGSGIAAADEIASQNSDSGFCNPRISGVAASRLR